MSSQSSPSTSSKSSRSHPYTRLPNDPPTIRLNSGLENILSMISDGSAGQRGSVARSLMGGRSEDSPQITQTSQFNQSRSSVQNQERGNNSGLRRNLTLYRQKKAVQESTELLLAPPRRDVRGRDNGEGPSSRSPPPATNPGPTLSMSFRSLRRSIVPHSPTPSPSLRSVSSQSRRSSVSSETSLESWASPFAELSDSQCRGGNYDDDDGWVHTQSISKWNIVPSSGMILYPTDVENDDDLHRPLTGQDKDEGCQFWTIRGLVNVGGLGFIALGILLLFLGWPVMTSVMDAQKSGNACAVDDPICLDVGNIPHLQNLRFGLIDPDTPDSVKSRQDLYGKNMNLVFSDEFNKDGRSFYDGDDPYWQAVDIWYGVTRDLEWFDPDAIWTENGTLNIRFDAFQNHFLNYRSGMLQSWNKLCFKGGYIESSISLPGRGDTIGFWPGFWTMGNLGRPGYPATTEGMWPYTYYDKCDAGITPNQSDPSGLSYLPGMKLPACTCEGEDHPTPGKSRSAPEIDAIEAGVSALGLPGENMVGDASQSFQCAPFDVFWQPDYDFVELYDPSITEMNAYTGGVYQQAISGVSTLNNSWYNDLEYQKYAFEYIPGEDGRITWYIGETPTWTLDGRALGANGNIGQRIIPQEPMSIIMNFGMSPGWSALNLTGIGKLLPAIMRFDYVRVYQYEGQESVTCDSPGYETTEYIRTHPEPYTNANLTMWSQTPYNWPNNSYMHNCRAANYSGAS